MTERWQALLAATGLLLQELSAGLYAAVDSVSARIQRATEGVAFDQVLPVILAVAAGLLITGLAVWFARRRTRSGVGKRSARARALAARGLEGAEIARQTGLSRDALSMLLLAESGRRGRRNLPLAARIADEEPREEAKANPRQNPQAYSARRVTGETRPRRFAAHRLLDRLSQSLRIPRFNRAA